MIQFATFLPKDVRAKTLGILREAKAQVASTGVVPTIPHKQSSCLEECVAHERQT
jgi:hypothetical protein